MLSKVILTSKFSQAGPTIVIGITLGVRSVSLTGMGHLDDVHKVRTLIVLPASISLYPISDSVSELYFSYSILRSVVLV